MKTIFAIGLFPDRNRTFVRHLCRNFKVIMFRNSHFLASKGYDVEFLEDIVEENDLRISSQNFEQTMTQNTQFIKTQIGALLKRNNDISLSETGLSTFKDMAMSAEWMSNAFRKLTKYKKDQRGYLFY